VIALLATAVEACRREGARLVFPANVWVFGRGRRGHLVSEDEPVAPVSKKGRVRAEQEHHIRKSGVRFAMVRLPEFYGPHVGTLTGPQLRAAATGGTATWFGDADLEVEFVFMPDAAKALVQVACASDVDGECFHLPGQRAITPRAFLEEAIRKAGAGARLRVLPAWTVRVASPFSSLAGGFADILHLWEAPILLDGAKYRRRFGTLLATPYEEGIAATLAWLGANPDARMHY
jgi:nucleoside-diphosphate-sugar epimerase